LWALRHRYLCVGERCKKKGRRDGPIQGTRNVVSKGARKGPGRKVEFQFAGFWVWGKKFLRKRKNAGFGYFCALYIRTQTSGRGKKRAPEPGGCVEWPDYVVSIHLMDQGKGVRWTDEKGRTETFFKSIEGEGADP